MTTPPEKIVAQVLIVEDEPEHADVMAEALRRPGHICTIVNGIQAAADELRHGSFDVIVTDLRMPESANKEGANHDGGDAGMRVLDLATQLQPDAETIMVTAHGDVPTARDAFKHGAFDFVEKPLDLIVFRSVVNRAAEQAVLRSETGELKDLVQHDGFEGIIAGSEAMRKILKTVKTVAASRLPVLITGESGTGKELIAQAVHNNSPRSKKRFVTMNCAGQAESLLEDQLFGHVRGAYTGAEKDREGLFEYADNGTMFLDEIGDMPIAMQAKLLRVLENGEVVRLGTNESKIVDVRFVSATNQDFTRRPLMGVFVRTSSSASMVLIYICHHSAIAREDIPRIVRHAVAKFGSELLVGQPIPKSAILRCSA